MLNSQLQQSINQELEKVKPFVKDFILSSYWKDTMALVCRVNHIKDEDIIEGVELETILFILEISEHKSVYEAFKNEVFINGFETTEANLKQLSGDIEKYILYKINENKSINSIYVKEDGESLHELINKEMNVKKDYLPENYINSRVSKLTIQKQSSIAPKVLDSYREGVTEEDMMMGRYTINSIKPKDRIKEIEK